MAIRFASAIAADVPSVDELKARARDLVPMLRDRARETETGRHVPDGTIDAMRKAGLFRILQPSAFNGYELDPLDFMEIVMVLAGGCGSSGWVYGILGVHPWHVALFDERAQQDVWGENDEALVASSYGATGSVERVDGGFVLDGTWRFSSGSRHADWSLLGGLVDTADGAPDGPAYHTFLVPSADYAIEDVWRTVGLAGTGSNTLHLRKVFVPEHRAHVMGEGIGGPGCVVNQAVAYRYPFSTVLTYMITATMLGIARSAIDSHIQMMRTRRRASFAGEKAAENAFSQKRVADADCIVSASILQLRHNLKEMRSYLERGEAPPEELRMRIRRDQTFGSVSAINATNMVFENSGGNALFLDNPIQRAWRDVNAARVHAANEWERAATAYGARLLGAPYSPANS